MQIIVNVEFAEISASEESVPLTDKISPDLPAVCRRIRHFHLF
jgi:hypothetical protein